MGVCQVVDRNIPGSSNPDMACRAKADKYSGSICLWCWRMRKVYLSGSIENFSSLAGDCCVLIEFTVTQQGSIVYIVVIAVPL